MRNDSPSSRLRALLGALAVTTSIGCGDSNGVGPAGSPTVRIVSGNGQTAEVGLVLPSPLVVGLRDTRGRAMVGTTIRFFDELRVVRDSAITDANGLATIRWTLGTRAATQYVIAQAIVSTQSPQLPEATFTQTARAGAPTRLRVSHELEFGVPGETLDTVTAAVVDRFDNGLVDVAVTWAITSGGGAVRAISNVTDAHGIARAIWTIGPTTGTNVLGVTASGFTGTATAISSPGFPATAVVTGGPHACALVPGGAAYCWGSNTAGELGIGAISTTPQTTPVRVSGGLVFKSLVAGVIHTCGLTNDGSAYCWGGNYQGQVGVGSGVVTTPTRVAESLRFVSLAAGAWYTCGLTTDGVIYCWGDDTSGQLGGGRDRSAPAAFGTLRELTPRAVPGSFVELVASYSTTCAVATGGQTYCWGSNVDQATGTAAGSCRMLADGYDYKQDWDLPCSTKPVAIESRTPLRSLFGVGFAFCGLTADRQIVCWGDGLQAPTVMGDTRVSTAWSLGHDACGLNDADLLVCWSIGLGGRVVPPPFRTGVSLANFSSVGNDLCALTRDQPAVVYCWGTNETGQLGDGTTTYRSDPVAVKPPRTRR